MTSTVEPLILDLVEWVAQAPRAYADVMDAWRTSCPRLPVWEDAIERGLVRRETVAGLGPAVVATDEGRSLLALHGRAAVAQDGRPTAAQPDDARP